MDYYSNLNIMEFEIAKFCTYNPRVEVSFVAPLFLNIFSLGEHEHCFPLSTPSSNVHHHHTNPSKFEREKEERRTDLHKEKHNKKTEKREATNDTFTPSPTGHHTYVLLEFP
jgi:hypothetical protein